MAWPRVVFVALVVGTSGVAARGVSAPEPAAAPAPAGPLLGRAHVWVKVGQVDLDDAAAREWGVDSEGYLGLEGYSELGQDFYLGGELSHAKSDRSITADGSTIRDFDFLSLEMNGKKAFDLRHGLSVDVGTGWSLFWVDGDEVAVLDGAEFTDPLADIGLGVQVFADLNWRVRRLLIGLDAKYQWAFDVIDIDYSNLRLGAHIGLAF